MKTAPRKGSSCAFLCLIAIALLVDAICKERDKYSLRIRFDFSLLAGKNLVLYRS